MANKPSVPFSDFRMKSEAPEKPLLETHPELKKHIKKFVMRNMELSENALVTLIVLHNTGTLDEKYKEELECFEYITNDNKISEKGNTYINDNKTIERLKSMI
jgi:hypothetical protein